MTSRERREGKQRFYCLVVVISGKYFFCGCVVRRAKKTAARIAEHGRFVERRRATNSTCCLLSLNFSDLCVVPRLGFSWWRCTCCIAEAKSFEPHRLVLGFASQGVQLKATTSSTAVWKDYDSSLCVYACHVFKHLFRLLLAGSNGVTASCRASRLRFEFHSHHAASVTKTLLSAFERWPPSPRCLCRPCEVTFLLFPHTHTHVGVPTIDFSRAICCGYLFRRTCRRALTRWAVCHTCCTFFDVVWQKGSFFRTLGARKACWRTISCRCCCVLCSI